MLTDCRKFASKWYLYEMSSFHFLPLESIQSLFSGAVRSAQAAHPQIFRDFRNCVLSNRNGDISQSHAANDDRLLRHVPHRI